MPPGGSMRSRLNIPVIFVLTTLVFPGSAAEPSDPNQSTKYLDAVRTFADNVLKYGRDTYGPKHTPLFVDGLNIHTREPVKWIAPNGDRWILSNLASQQNLLRTLDGLTKVTGDPKYKQAAMDAIEYAFENLRSPNGLLQWGGHQAYDVGAGRPCGRTVHEMKGFYPYYELMWEVDPDATERFIEAFWSGHILDWSTLDMDRHCYNLSDPLNKPWDYHYEGGAVFFQGKGLSGHTTGSDLYYAAAFLTKFTGNKKPLVWGKRLAHRFLETRDSRTGISYPVFTVWGMPTKSNDKVLKELVSAAYVFPYQGRVNKALWECCCGYDMPTPGTVVNVVTAHWICQLILADLLGSEGQEFTQWALEELTAWGKVSYRKRDNVLIPMRFDGTSLEGYVCKQDGPLGFKGTSLEPLPAGTTELWAYALAYCFTGDQLMWDMTRSIALGNDYGDIGTSPGHEPRLNFQTAVSDPYAVNVFLHLYNKTGKRDFLKMARRVGDNVLIQRFHKGFFVPDSQHTFTKLDAIDPLALLHLHSAWTGNAHVLIPKVWPARPFFDAAYRSKDQIVDNQLIYTLRGLAEPPKSLQEAAAEGDFEAVRLLIAQGIDVDHREDSFFKTALHHAAINGHKNIVQFLLTKGAQIDAWNGYPGGTPLDYAAEKGHKEVAELLIIGGANVNAKRGSPAGDTPLHSAVRAGYKEIVNLLIANGADVNAKNDSEQTPIDIAVGGGRREIRELLQAKIADSSIHGAASLGVSDKVKAFIKNGVDVNEEDAQGMTPLHLAVQGGHREIVEFLLSQGADVNAKNNEGKTPLELALSERQHDIESLLVEAGADIPTIHMAAFVGSLDKLRKFVETGTDVDAKDENGRTPLLRAIRGKQIEAVKFLIDHGADVNTRDEQGYVPLVYALWTVDPKMVRLLVNEGADIRAKDTSGYTPLHWAVMMGSKELTELILEAGGDVNAKSGTAETPLDLARQGGPEIVELLRKHMVAHSVAATSISAPTHCAQGDMIPIAVGVENKGDYDESFDVTLTDVANGREIGRKSVTLVTKDESTSEADLTFTGETSGRQNFGNFLAVGDVNGDGYDDLLVSASAQKIVSADQPPIRYQIIAEQPGRAYLFYGGKDMDNIPDKIFTGENIGDAFGAGSPAYLADMNNDGFGDVILGARYYKSRGRVYMYYGGPDMDVKPDIIIEPEEGITKSSFGVGLSVGNVNGDGYKDLIVAAHEYDQYRGRVYLYYGGDPFDTTIDKIFTGENAKDVFGHRICARGDVDGDGYDDLLTGARYWPKWEGTGRAYLYYGAPGRVMDEIRDVVFTGEHRGDQFGTAIDLFDIDHDGYADVVIGARNWPGDGTCQGRGYVYWGSSRATMDNIPDMVLDGEEGVASAMGGDTVRCGYVNHDEFGDIILSGYNYIRSDKRGRAYLYYGNSKSSMDDTCDHTFTGEVPGSLPTRLNVADFNGDGQDDVAIGGNAYPHRNNQGRAWLWYGPFNNMADLTFHWDTTTVSPGKHTLRASIGPVEGEEDTADNTMTVEVEIREAPQSASKE
jgi:pectate lyase